MDYPLQIILDDEHLANLHKIARNQKLCKDGEGLTLEIIGETIRMCIAKVAGETLSNEIESIAKLPGMSDKIIKSHMVRWGMTEDEYAEEYRKMNGFFLKSGNIVRNPEAAIYNWLKSPDNEFEKTRKQRNVANNYANCGFIELINKLPDMDFAIAMEHCIRFDLTVNDYNSLVQSEYFLIHDKGWVKGKKTTWESHMYKVCGMSQDKRKQKQG